MSNVPSGGIPKLVLYDDSSSQTFPNALHVTVHDGRVYLEMRGIHGGVEVTTVVRVDKSRLVASLRGWGL